eukprot:SAG31_NODE_182_length_21094_cov_4.426721_3_plen_71_part_00
MIQFCPRSSILIILNHPTIGYHKRVGAQAGLANVDILSSYPKFAFIANLVNRQKITCDNNSCPVAPAGPE